MPTPTLPVEEELRLSDSRLRTLARTSAVVLWHTSALGSVDRQNPSWEAFTGQSYAEYAGHGWLDAIHPDDRARVDAQWQAAVAAPALMEMSYRLRRHDGAYRQVAAQGAPLLEDGALREWVGSCVDVTADRLASSALRSSEERLQLLDRIGEATRVLTDADAVMATTARMLGEHLGATRCAYADVDPDNDRFTIRSDWSVPGVASSAGVYSLELFGPLATANLRRGLHLVVRDVDRELGDDAGGRMFNAIGIQAIVCAGLVKEGRLVAMMAVHQASPRDWTAQDIAIVAEVVDRSWAHIERVRDHAKLREQDRRKDEFLATLAHELRNPLAPMKYALAVLRRSSEPAHAVQAQQVIDRQISHMARLIDDLLDVSRINRGLVRLQREHVSLPELMLQAVETARPAIEAAGHRLELALPDEALRLDADPVRIVQGVGNLLTNAAKYTPDGGRIRLAARRLGDRALIEVTDNGLGVPPDQQPLLFQMFTQLETHAARAKGGLGIGLALVRSLVEMHGGAVRMHSAGLDQGSTFTIELPLAGTSASARPAADAGTTTAAGAPARARVLVVEDNRDGLASLMALLDALGYEVAGAADGNQAVALARTFRPRIVLLDLGLPGRDGFAVARALREEAALEDVFIVALTGWGGEEDRVRTAEAGFHGHLTKPVEPGALEDYLGRLAAVPA